MKSVSIALLVGAMAVALSACGGGGGGGGSTSSAAVTSFTATCADGTTKTSTTSQAAAAAACPTGSAIVVSVPNPTYGSSENLAAFNRLNTERANCGFGLLAQNTLMDNAAAAHSAWQLANNVQTHNETSGTAGFTGVLPSDRLTSSGYTQNAAVVGGEVIGGQTGTPGPSGVTGFGDISVRTLLSAPYHELGMLFPAINVGISVQFQTPTVPGNLFEVNTMEIATPSSSAGQQLGASDVLTYPCAGTTGVNFRLTNESPSPVPGRNLATNPTGPAIAVLVKQGQTLTITSASMVNVATSAPVTLLAPVTAANDPANTLYLFGNFLGYILPSAPLATNTQYQVTINGTNNGTAFTRSFTFTTGTGG